MKKALITGITGQDGSYIAEFLLSKGYEVHGIIRRASTFNTCRIDHIIVNPHEPSRKLKLYYGDLSDGEQISNIIYNVKPDEVYHLGAQSHVKVSFEMPEYTTNITAIGTTRLLEAIRKSGMNVKIYHAASSEMFGASKPPQNENTQFSPKSPYACSKVYSHWMIRNYREGYGIFASNGIMFNHESPRRGETFVTKKITRGIASIIAKQQDKIYLGNLDAKRDWGFAPEYVEVMWKILQQKEAEDFVVGTGESHSVKEFVENAFAYTNLDYKKYVKIEPIYFRPTDVNILIADSRKAKKKLNWKPKIMFDDLVKIMVDADLRAIGLEPIGDGDKILRRKFPRRWWKVD